MNLGYEAFHGVLEPIPEERVAGERWTVDSTEIAGDMVTLSFGMGGYELVYTGTLDAGGSSMQGNVGIAGVSGDFKGKKQ